MKKPYEFQGNGGAMDRKNMMLLVIKRLSGSIPSSGQLFTSGTV